mgnify:CR=1 FL=1
MSKKLNCLLLDDELQALSYLKMLCEQISSINVVKAFNRPDVFLSEIEHLDFDFCIMDIQMPYMNGLHVAQKLLGKPVIFTTAHIEFAADAFDVDAVDFVRKPIQLDRLIKATDKVIAYMTEKKSPNKFLKVNTSKGKYLLNYETISYIKSSQIDSRDKDVFMMDGTKVTIKNTSFENLLSKLPANNFCRINKAEIISLNLVSFFTADSIVANLSDTQGNKLTFSLSEAYRKGFLERVKI